MATSASLERPLALTPTDKSHSRGRLAFAIVFALVVAASAPTTGDFGLTWDEPTYRTSQRYTEYWWRDLAQGRSINDLQRLIDPEALLFYWPYARHGLNFHPPLAGQISLLSGRLLGGFLQAYPARRMATVFEFALAVALLFTFLRKRSGIWVAGVSAAALVLMPRVYGQAHLMDTDIPGMALWLAAALACWKGVEEPKGGAWRIATGILLGLCFVEKMAAVTVLLPLVAWLGARGARRWWRHRDDRTAAALDLIITSALILAPLVAIAFEVRRLSEGQLAAPPLQLLPPPQRTNLFIHRPQSLLPDWFLVLPTAAWLLRCLLRRTLGNNRILSRERPTIEAWAAIAGLAPLVGWLGNPAWWRESIPRLAHYTMLSFARKGSLPPIQIFYRDRIYSYSLPWESAWVLIAITVPATLLFAAAIGLPGCLRRDPLKRYFLLHLATLPLLRLFTIPAHDGVRLFLPTFAFLAAFCGWGSIALADQIARLLKTHDNRARILVSAAILAPAAFQLALIHPYELSYYNELVGGPRNAWHRGFELTYWYDAFNPPAIRQLNAMLPKRASLAFANDLSTPPTMEELQHIGALRADLDLQGAQPEFRYRWLLTHDSKTSAFTRLLFAMRPWYALRPRQLDGARVFTVADPVAASRAWALQLLTDAAYTGPPISPAAPEWITKNAPWFARFWGDGVEQITPIGIYEPIFDWAKSDPESLRAAARAIANSRTIGDDPQQKRLGAILKRHYDTQFNLHPFDILIQARPEALAEAAEILIRRGDDVRRVLTHLGYLDLVDAHRQNIPQSYLDDDLTSPR